MALNCFFVKSSEFGERITLFRCDFVRSAVDYCWYVKFLSFCMFSAIKSIDKHSFLRKVDCKIFITSWSRNSTHLGINVRVLTQ